MQMMEYKLCNFGDCAVKCPYITFKTDIARCKWQNSDY